MMRSPGRSSAKRVVSLLPGATEIVVLLEQEAGLIPQTVKLDTPASAYRYSGLLVGRSHQCDFPKYLAHLPELTVGTILGNDSLTIHNKVTAALAAKSPLYSLQTELLMELKPDVILTQDVCDVCAMDTQTIERIALRMDPKPRVLNLHPQSLRQVLENILQVGDAVGLNEAAATIHSRLLAQVDSIRSQADDFASKRGIKQRVELLEWTHPLFGAGHWTAEMLHMAGGSTQLNAAHVPSVQTTPENLVEADPEALIIAPCGLNLDTAQVEASKLLAREPWFRNLSAVRRNRVALVDGNQHFNRQGPRLVEAFRWLVAWLHDTPALLPLDFPFRMLDCSPAGVTAAERAFPPLADTASPPGSGAAAAAAADIEACHTRACAGREAFYTDPGTGYVVMTAWEHRRRGFCCGNACRHCPYGHYNALRQVVVLATL